MQDIIPAKFMERSQLLPFLTWLNTLSIDKEAKYSVLFFWADRVEVKITSDMFIRSGLR